MSQEIKSVNRRNFTFAASAIVMISAGAVYVFYPYSGSSVAIAGAFFLIPFLVCVGVVLKAYQHKKELQILLDRSQNDGTPISVLEQRTQTEEFSTGSKSAFLAVLLVTGGVFLFQTSIATITMPIVGLAIALCTFSLIHNPPTIVTLCTNCKKPLPDVTQHCPSCGLLNIQPPIWYANYTILGLYSGLLSFRIALQSVFDGGNSVGMAVLIVILSAPVIALTVLYQSATRRPLKPKGLLVSIKFFATVIGGGASLVGVLVGALVNFGVLFAGLVGLLLTVLGLSQKNT